MQSKNYNIEVSSGTENSNLVNCSTSALIAELAQRFQNHQYIRITNLQSGYLQRLVELDGKSEYY